MPCARVGQTVEVWRVDATGLKTVLGCGHPYVVPLNEIETRFGRVDLEEIMKKQTIIPNGKGVILVQGFDEEVQRYALNHKFAAQLGEAVSNDKDLFRKLAKEAAAKADGEVRRVEFINGSKEAVKVSIPDPSLDGNRVNLSAETLKKLANLGVSVDELGVAETAVSFVLTGPWVKFMQDVLANYAAQGVEPPDGAELIEKTRLSAEGIERLKELAERADSKQIREAATLLLEKGVKSSSVGVGE